MVKKAINKSKSRSKSKSRIGFISSLVFITLLTLVIAFGWKYYRILLYPNILVGSDKREVFFYVKTGSDYQDVLISLQKQKILKNKKTFIWLAEKVKYQQNIHPGRYLLRRNMSNFELIRMLRSGKNNVPVELVINTQRTTEEIAGYIGNQMEIDSATIIKWLNNPEFLRKHGLNRQNSLCLFIPNSYDFYWNSSLDKLLGIIINEYDQFWSNKRLYKAQKLGLKPVEVSVLASIVQQETNHEDEMSTIAGVYLNRLKKRMKLQADPTVKYIITTRKVRRLYNGDLDNDSPYNTYKHYGLPPGPICLPQVRTLEAVLDADDHKYLYFCAKSDLSGYHLFSETYAEHSQNAQEYRDALNRQNIR
jgi:UPF0755 protein